MARTDNDSWDLASSVGMTATGVAAARAIASRGDTALINDPFAEPLVRAVGVELFTRLASGEITAAEFDDDGSAGGPMGMARMADNMAVRTRFFDDFFTGAGDCGIRQAVILASGLDSRAYRLAWTPRTVVYEVDQPAVIEFKTRVLAEQCAAPTAERRTVSVDLRDDWTTALRSAGFDPSVPTAWSAEGLLPYLPPEAQDRLLENITALSSPGSQLAVENMSAWDADTEHQVRQRMQQSAQRMRAHGVDLDMADLFYFGERNEASGYLVQHGWQVDSSTVSELFAQYGLPPVADDEDNVRAFGGLSYVIARRGK